jgi:hypothetical protein
MDPPTASRSLPASQILRTHRSPFRRGAMPTAEGRRGAERVRARWKSSSKDWKRRRARRKGVVAEMRKERRFGSGG